MKKSVSVVSSLTLGALLLTGIALLGRSNNVASADEEKAMLYANSPINVNANQSTSFSVYAKNVTEISTLAIEVHASEGITISNCYNSYSSAINDINISGESINASYIFSDDTDISNSQLFYFTYYVPSSYASSTITFDILVAEAFNAAGEVVEIEGCRYTVNVKEYVPTYSAYGYSSISASSLKINESTHIYYYLGSYSTIYSGSFEFTYDFDLFELVSYEKGSFFNNSLSDTNVINSTIYFSFARSEAATNNLLCHIVLKAKVNDNVSSSITFKATDLCDKALNTYKFSVITNTLNIKYDANYIDESVPAIYSYATYADKKVTLHVAIEANSHIGAGDFVMSFDTDLLTYASHEKKNIFDYLGVNIKNISTGVIKLSVINTEDYLLANEFVSIEFDYLNPCDDNSITFSLTGSGITDSLTNPITLNVKGTSIDLVGEHTYGDWYVTKDASYSEDGTEEHCCSICGYKETRSIDKLELTGNLLELFETLKMDSFIGQSRRESGDCSEDFMSAKEIVLNLTESELSFFKNSSDTYISEGRERYEAWAIALNENPYSIGKTNSLNRYVKNQANETSSSLAIVIVALGTLLLLPTLALISSRKKK